MEQMEDSLNKIQEPLYATFWQRLAATFIDGFILLPVTMGLTYYSLIYVKSYLLSLTPSLVSLFYKCFLEKKYGATFGKKIMKIHVCSENFQALTNKEVYMRNFYYFVAVVLAIYTHYALYNMPGLASVTSYIEAVHFQSSLPITPKAISYILSMLFGIDCLLMLYNEKNQTLHDRLGKTVVIKK